MVCLPDGGVDPIRKNIGWEDLWHTIIKLQDVRHATAQDNDVRIEDINHIG